MLRWVAAAVAAAGCTSVLTGCTVPPGGVVGLMIDDEGRAVAVVQMCEGHIDGATLYRDDRTFGKWQVSSPVTGFSQFALDSGGNGWAMVGEFEARAPEQRYTIYGWSNDSSWSATHLEFSDHELSVVKPGTVLVPEREREGNRTESLADFKTRTCEDWG